MPVPPPQDLFNQERQSLEQAQRLESEARGQATALGDGFVELLEAYQKLYRQFTVMVNTHDRHESKLLDAQKALQAELARRTEVERQLRENEAALREAKEVAERALEDKARFFASMSHELRTPLGGVVTTAKLLALSPLSAAQTDYVQTIIASGDLLMAVINDLLDFSRLESGKVALEEIPVDLELALEESLDLMGATAAAKRLELIGLGEPLPPVLCDPHRLKQVLVNLIGNAVKFTETGEVTAGFELEENQVHFYVSDTGPGISPTVQKRLFAAFGQADVSTNRKFGGTGLGLSICKTLVELFGGKIWLDSQLGQGAQFHFTLPYRPQAAAKPEQASLLQGHRFLLAVGSPQLKTQICRLINRYGGACDCHLLGGRSIEALKDRADYHAFIVDRHLPDLGGQDSLEWLAQFRPLPPVVLLNPKGLPLGVQDPAQYRTLTKPIRSSALVAALLAPEQSQDTTARAPKLPLLNETYPFKVLVAEDNPTNLKVALAALGSMGYTADSAENGVVVMEKLYDQDYDLILMDMEMPEMDGLQTSQVIKGAWPGPHIPLIIGLSANATDQDRKTCLLHGMDDFLAKPLQLNQLAERIALWGQRLIEDPDWHFCGEPRPAAPEPALLDPGVIQRLRSTYEPRLVDELVGSFLEDLEGAAETLGALLEPDSLKHLKLEAHRIKGACLSLGVLRAAAALKALEDDITENQGAHRAALLAQFIAVQEPSVKEIRARLLGPSN
ncbi:MAG: ATP-binding protein [bacterium]|nr:ATP-binding protein [bacterium]